MMENLIIKVMEERANQRVLNICKNLNTFINLNDFKQYNDLKVDQNKYG